MKNLLLILTSVLFFSFFFVMNAWAENNNISLCEKEGNVKICSQLCDAGNGSACYKLGHLYIYDGKKGIKQDYAKGLDSYQKACDAKYVLACTDLAELYRHNGKVKQNYFKFAELNQKACYLGDANSCSELGSLYLKLSELSQKRYCQDLGNTDNLSELGYLCQEGKDIEKNKLKAKQFYKRAIALYQKECAKGNAWDCDSLEYFYKQGKGVEKDELQAKRFRKKTDKLYEIACNNGNSTACHNLGNSLKKFRLKEAELYQKACDEGSARDCEWLGSLYGHGLEEDHLKEIQLYKKAAELHEKACNNGDLHACFSSGILHEKGLTDANNKPNYLKATELYQKACDQGDASTCYLLGNLYYQNGYNLGERRGLRDDYFRAREFFCKACESNHYEACQKYALFSKSKNVELYYNVNFPLNSYDNSSEFQYSEQCSGTDISSCCYKIFNSSKEVEFLFCINKPSLEVKSFKVAELSQTSYSGEAFTLPKEWKYGFRIILDCTNDKNCVNNKNCENNTIDLLQKNV